ncbi:MAG: hypothetical protein P1V35_06715, partial [Planctomycetota bacterium]|nr:hypothetical protein [Planctomycetota bacterium]
LAVAIPVLLSSLTVPALLETVGTSMNYGDLVRCSIYQWIFLGTIFSIAFAFSALGEQPLKIAFVLLFLCIAEFAIYMVKTITHYSIFRWSDIQTYAAMIGTNEMPRGQVGIMVLIQAVAFTVGFAIFRRRTP